MGVIAVRRESVVLDLDDRLTPGLVRAAAAAGLLDRELKGLDGRSVSTSRAMSDLEGETTKTSRSLESGGRSIDKYSGRLGLLVSALGAVGPAAVPIAAVAVPAVAALGSDVVSLGAGVGVAELAFHGLGKTLTAFNKAAAEPTATNIAAAQLAMDELPPSAQRLVLELHRLTPVLDKLRQDAAGGGFAAGVTDGIHSLLKDTPLVRTAVRGISGELGTLSRDAGHALASDQWKPFLRFAGREAPGALHIMGAATGDVAHGLAEVLMAFGPLTHQFDAGILKLAQDFDHWATSLGKTKDFQSFVAYIETNGPRVVSLVGDLGQLFVDLVKAAAPLGGPTVQALDGIVKLLDAIASSPLGTPLILLAQINAILSLTGRALTALGVEARIGFGGIQTGAVKSTSVLGVLRAEAVSTGSALKTMFSNIGANASTGKPLLSGVSKGQIAGLAKTGLQGAGFALVASGAADKLGVANTATLALAGSFAGPLGTAAGAAVGFISDVSQTTDQLTAAINADKQAIANWDLAGQKQALADLQGQQDKIFSDRSSLAHGNAFKLPSVVKTGISQIFSGAPQALIDQVGAGFTAQGQQATELGKIYDQLSGKASGVELTQSQLSQTLVRVQPAMQALGITTGDLTAAYQANDGSFNVLVQRLVRYTSQADTTSGKTNAVAAAFAAMSNSVLTADQRIQALSTSLDAALDPKINLSAARDALQKGLNDLDKNLSKTTKSLHGQSDAAIQNRGAIRDQVSGIKDLIEKQAAAGAPTSRLTATLNDQRQKLLDAGHAAGISKQDMKSYIDELGLTPKFVKTAIQLNGVPQAQSEIQRIIDSLNRIHDKNIHINTFTNATVADHVIPSKRRAGGGPITGPGGPTDDAIPAWLSNGEYVMRASAVAKYGRMTFDHMNAQGYASGGTVTPTSSSSSSSSTQHISPAERAHQHALAADTAALSTHEARLKSLVQAEQQYAQQVAQSLRSDLFSQQSVWGQNASPQAILKGDIKNARQFNRSLHTLVRKGVSGGALAAIAQSGNLQAAQMLAGEDRNQLHRYQRLFRERQHLTARTGQYAAIQRYGDKIDAVRAEIRSEKAEVIKLRHEVAHLRHEAPGNADRTGQAVRSGLQRDIRQGVRRKNP